MWFPTKAALDRALLLRILQQHDRESASSGEMREDSAPAPDPTMVYSMLTDCHRQLVTISRGIWLLAFVVSFVCLARQ